jgi:hypothetical protein
MSLDPCSDPTCHDGILGILIASGTPICCPTCCSSVGILYLGDVDEAFDAFDTYVVTRQFLEADYAMARA